jgi:hypothetical protein
VNSRPHETLLLLGISLNKRACPRLRALHFRIHLYDNDPP